jgi:aspartate aminotransferase
MLSEKMLELGKKRSAIREIFEYGKARAQQIGADNVFDFSIGNPNVPPPDCIKETIVSLLATEDPVLLHGYSSAQGDANVRKAIADYVNKTHGTKISGDNIYMTAGAAASLTICCKALSVPGDEFIIFAPYFPEYKVFVEASGAKPVILPPNEPDFQISVEKLRSSLSERTKAVIVNSPNNPSGAVYSKETLRALCSALEEKSSEYGHPIYLISDEPYRELVYGDVEVPYLVNYYKNTLVCYSYSKSLSLPGERIGYIIVSPEATRWEDVYAAICGAGRALGYVCAPSLFQQVIARCVDKTSDISVYKTNRDLLYNGLVKLGFECVNPDGAFYLFVKSPEPDAIAFCEKAKKYELLLVAGDGFGCPGYVRISYCVKTEQIVRSMPAFEKLAAEYSLRRS